MAQKKKTAPVLQLPAPPWINPTVEYWLHEVIRKTDQQLEFMRDSLHEAETGLAQLRECVNELPAEVRTMSMASLRKPAGSKPGKKAKR